MAKKLTEEQKVKNQIKEREKRTKEIEKQKKFEREICAKLESMTKEERIEFLTKLSDKLQIVEAKIKDVQNVKDKIDFNYVYLTQTQEEIVQVACGLICGVASGLTIGFALQNSIVGAFAGVIGAYLTFFLVGPVINNEIEKNRLMNAIKKLKVMTADKKIVKLNDLQLKLAKQVEIAKKIAGEKEIIPEGVAYLTLEPSKTGEGVAYLVLEPNEKDSKIKQTKCKEITK